MECNGLVAVKRASQEKGFGVASTRKVQDASNPGVFGVGNCPYQEEQ